MPYGFNDDKSKFDLDDLIGSVATIETSPATANHAKGEYLVYNSQLHKVTSAIATGEALVVGTNIEVTNLGDELNGVIKTKTFSVSATGNWVIFTPTGVNINKIVNITIDPNEAKWCLWRARAIGDVAILRINTENTALVVDASIKTINVIVYYYE